MENEITIAVVIPMYNPGRQILRAIGSVLQQTVPANEVIVVDDGSSDGSAELVIKTFSGIRVVKQDNNGEGSARNLGVITASSKWIAFLDSDDFWLPNHLAVALGVIEKNPEASFVSTGCVRWSIDTPLVINQKLIKTDRVDYFQEQISDPEVVTSSSALVKKEVILNVGGFGSLRNHADTDMWERLALESEFARSTEVTAVYVHNSNGASAKFGQTLKSKSPNWEELLYLSKNLELVTTHQAKKSSERYQNRLKWLNVRILLSHNEFSLAKMKSQELTGDARIWERIGMYTVTRCSVRQLQLIVRLVKTIRNI
jgi:glycosyltransferase involved in cell wall biosynthesis